MTPQRLLSVILIAWLTAAAPLAHAACTPLRFGYPDQARPPYYLGDGPNIPASAGVLIDQVREAVIAAGFGCAPQLVRLPPARLRHALASGDIDLTPLVETAEYPPEIVIPLDKNGAPDIRRAMGYELVVLVRAQDYIPPGANPVLWFKGKTLGVPQGSLTASRLRELGLAVDEGARDVARNIEKLRLGRIAGVVVPVARPGHVEALLKPYHGEIVRLPRSLLNSRAWFAFNQRYYAQHKEQAEALWNWFDANRDRLDALMQKHGKE